MLLGALGALGGLGGRAEAQGSPSRVLFLGNSYTFGHGGLGELVEELEAARDGDLDAGQVAFGGFTLEDHFEQSRGGRRELVAGGWTRVVLQEQSLRPIADRAAFERWGRLLVTEARTVGADVTFFLTWARQARPEQQPLLTDAYCSLARELGADLAPVGEAWRRSLRLRPDLALHLEDGSHPNPRGAYLAAMILWATLTGGHPGEVPTVVPGGLAVGPEDAGFLRQVAADTLARHRRGEICSTELSLRQGRFHVEVSWRGPFGGKGAGHPVPLTDDTGAFWFFEPANLELLVKVLDGRTVNGWYWVFYGALSNVEYTLEVTDTFTGEKRQYSNPQSRLASRADTRAFPADP